MLISNWFTDMDFLRIDTQVTNVLQIGLQFKSQDV